MFSDFSQLQNSLSSESPRTLVVAAAHDKHTLEAVFDAVKAMPMKYILVGDKIKIETISKQLGVTLAPSEIIEARDDEACARLSIECIRQGKGNALMKGLIETGTLLKAALDKEQGIRGTGTMSHLAILEVPAYHKLIGVTDGGMLPHPTLAQKADIARNAIEFFHRLGSLKPNVAVLAASETQSDKMPETKDAIMLTQMCIDGELGACNLEGPLSFDIAVSKESAKIKKHPSGISEDVDILLMPSVATGNIFCKGLLYWGGAKMAGCVLGAKVPIVLVSRGASAEEKLFSIMLCLKAGA
jgi:phosphate butyryltransferase